MIGANTTQNQHAPSRNYTWIINPKLSRLFPQGIQLRFHGDVGVIPENLFNPDQSPAGQYDSWVETDWMKWASLQLLRQDLPEETIKEVLAGIPHLRLTIEVTDDNNQPIEVVSLVPFRNRTYKEHGRNYPLAGSNLVRFIDEFNTEPVSQSSATSRSSSWLAVCDIFARLGYIPDHTLNRDTLAGQPWAELHRIYSQGTPIAKGSRPEDFKIWLQIMQEQEAVSHRPGSAGEISWERIQNLRLDTNQVAICSSNTMVLLFS